MLRSLVRFLFLIFTVLSKINLSSTLEVSEASAFSSASAESSFSNYDNDYYNQCQAQEPAQQSTPPNSELNKELEAKFNKGNLQFTANFFYNVVKGAPGQSVTMSPYSTLFLLAQLALFATGETAQQLLNALNLNNQNEIEYVIPAVLDTLTEQKNVILDLAEKVYGNIKSELSYSFKEKTRNIFRAEAENIDFDNPQEAADIINKWVADNTNGKIQGLVPASDLTPNTELVLTDALYFLSEWRYKFNSKNTRPQNFYAADNYIITVSMMNQINYFAYAESNDLNAQAIELPYINSNLTCLILLPYDTNGATNLVMKLLDPNALTSVRSSLQDTRVDLSLPKYNTTTNIDLKDILKKLNITEIFDPYSGGLRGILAKPQDIYVSAGIQKANIEITESGTEATAANAIIGVGASAGIPAPPTRFNADHPFIYYLLLEGIPFFCGLFAGN